LIAVMMLPVGVAAAVFMTSASGLQEAAPQQVRGLVLGLYLSLFVGGTALGAPLMGSVAEEFGERAPVVIGPAAAVLAVLTIARWLRRYYNV
jgi:predicted MFS family arabinose efflux permease